MDSTQRVCGSCNRFIIKTAYQIADGDRRLSIFSTDDSELYRLDSCALQDHHYWFCASCYNVIQRGLPPKYSMLNDVNVTFCQQYPEALEGLTSTEELLVSRCHPIASIVKLRPNAVRTPVAYNRLRGHAVVLPQDPGPLLDILPSDSLRLHDRIKVVWFGKNAPAMDDLKPYLEVRKHVVYTALLWLRNHNKLYSRIVINSDALDSLSDSFIPQSLLDAVVHADDDSHEREGYAFGSATEGLENDFHQALPDEIPDSIGSGCVYTDLESARQRPTLQLISTVMDLERERLQSATTVTGTSVGERPQYVDDVPVIRYSSNGRLVLMNDWQDADYFTGAFPTLFPYGVGGHISISEFRPVPVSLKAWAKWALGHHSRRFAQHPTFLYLVYDVLRRRHAALGNSIVVKRKDWEKAQAAISRLTLERLSASAKSVLETGSHNDPDVRLLESTVQSIASHVPQSFGRLRVMRVHLRALFIAFGMPAFWLTINPADLRSPLVLRLASIEVPLDGTSQRSVRTRNIGPTMNPVAVAQFFHATCSAIFDALLQVKSGECGIFGNVSNYFGAVETNGRGMLHLHCLIWLAGNVDFYTLRNRLNEDPDFAHRMTQYLDSIIKCSINQSNDDLTDEPSGQWNQTVPCAARKAGSDACFMDTLLLDATRVATKRQMHSRNHTRACYKYSKGPSRECRFLFPRQEVDNT